MAGWGGILALLWCCVVPAALAFAFSGVGAGLARGVRGPLGWGSLVLSVVLIARANWLVWVRGQGGSRRSSMDRPLLDDRDGTMGLAIRAVSRMVEVNRCPRALLRQEF